MDDFRAVLRASPDQYLLLAPDLTIVEASDAYLRATMTERAEVLGRGMFDVFPDNPAEPESDGVTNLRASLQDVLQNRRPSPMPVQRYPIRVPGSEDFEERFWEPLNSPVMGDDGEVLYVLHRVVDVTEAACLQREKLELKRKLQDVTFESARHRELFDHAPDATVIVGSDGRIRLVNAQTEVLFGYAREELIGRPLDVLIPERFRAKHVGHMSRYFAKPAARPMGSRLELYGRRRDGSEVPIEVSLSPLRAESGEIVSASIRDVSERRRLEAEARITADRLRSAVDSIQDAFALFDAQDRMILCNSAFRRLVQAAAPETLVGKSYAEVLDAWIDGIAFADEAARDRFRAERIARRPEPSVTFDVRMRDGRSLRVLDRQTVEGGIVKTIWDLTEDEARATELREARSHAEAASAAKSEFLSSVSHELRTPLNAVLGFAQLLVRDRRDPLGARHRERVEHILASGQHLLRLIDDVLDLSKIEAGRISLSLEPVSVAAVVAEVSRALEPIAASKAIPLEVPPVPKVPLVVADPTRFLQILMNFGSNAIKYNRPGGYVRIEVSTPTTGTVRVAVADSGVGIPIDRQDQLFQPFQRAGQETGPIEGTGIGLAITKRLADLMHATVGFRSVPNEGSLFWVELPVDREDAATSAPMPDPPLREERPRDDGRRLVLCVEDNPANVAFVRDLMSSIDGIELVTLPTAELGVEFARARRPALVLMDINLPGMSGLDALRALQSQEETRNIPVIALTAAASERDRQKGLNAGFFRYLSKPADIDELLEAVDSVLGGASSGAK